MAKGKLNLFKEIDTVRHEFKINSGLTLLSKSCQCGKCPFSKEKIIIIRSALHKSDQTPFEVKIVSVGRNFFFFSFHPKVSLERGSECRKSEHQKVKTSKVFFK